jgi:hypothetical protein
MKKNILGLFGILLIVSLVLSACGGGEPVADEKPVVPPTQAQLNQESATAKANPSDKTRPMLHIALTKGLVEIRETPDGQWVPAQKGQKLGAGAEIRTGADSVVALFRDALSMVTLDRDSVMLVKKLAFEAKHPITILTVINGAATVDHKGELPKGSVLAIENPDKQQSGVQGSIVRVSYNAETKTMTATCFSGDCYFAKGGQTLNLRAGQQVDEAGVAALDDMPDVTEISAEQADAFLDQAHALCGCNLSISEIIDAGLISFAPLPDDVPTPEEDLQTSADENGDTDPATTEISDEQVDQIADEVTNEIIDGTTEEPAVTEDPAMTEEPAATEEPAP